MHEPSMRKREADAWFRFLAAAETERELEARIFQTVFQYTTEDVETVCRLFSDIGATTGFAFMGADITDHSESIQLVEESEHEVVYHGHRHGSFDVDYETASEEIKAGKEALDEVLTTPGWGMSAPGIDVSEGTLRAAADLGLEFVIGRTYATAPDDIAIFQPEEPYAATGILEGGTSPANTFEQLRDAATPGKIYILHPPHLENYGAMDEFEAFIRDIQPVSPSRLLQNPDEIGVVLDCTRPVKLL